MMVGIVYPAAPAVEASQNKEWAITVALPLSDAIAPEFRMPMDSPLNGCFAISFSAAHILVGHPRLLALLCHVVGVGEVLRA